MTKKAGIKLKEETLISLMQNVADLLKMKLKILILAIENYCKKVWMTEFELEWKSNATFTFKVRALKGPHLFDIIEIIIKKKDTIEKKQSKPDKLKELLEVKF
jgi:hypothetical protein